MMKEKFLSNKKMYSFSTECKCGVFVDESTMRKIQKALYKAEAEIKNILHNSENVEPYSWGMVTVKDGNGKIEKSSYYHFSDYHWNTAKDRINALKLTTPEYVKDYYIIKNDEERKELEECLLQELNEEI